MIKSRAAFRCPHPWRKILISLKKHIIRVSLVRYLQYILVGIAHHRSQFPYWRGENHKGTSSWPLKIGILSQHIQPLHRGKRLDIFGIGAHFKRGYVLNIYPLYKVHHPKKLSTIFPWSTTAPKAACDIEVRWHRQARMLRPPWATLRVGKSENRGVDGSPFWEVYGWSTYPLPPQM